MVSSKYHLHDGKAGAALAIRVVPRASKNEIVEILNDGRIKIHLTAPPVDGKANEALIKFLANILEVSKSQLELIAGAGGRDKLISVIEMDAETVQRKIKNNMK